MKAELFETNLAISVLQSLCFIGVTETREQNKVPLGKQIITIGH